MHHHDTTRLLLDERWDLLRGVEAALHQRPQPLGKVVDPSPGAYLLLYRGELDCYQRLARPGGVDDRRCMVAAGGYPIYAGSATALGQRARRHVLNVRACVDVSSDDLMMVTLPTATPAGALYLEAMLIAAFRPVWNQAWLAGFGSQPQGSARRRHQRVPAWNVLHPGRRVDDDAPRPEVTADELTGQVVRHLEETVPSNFTHQLAAGSQAGLRVVRQATCGLP